MLSTLVANLATANNLVATSETNPASVAQKQAAAGFTLTLGLVAGNCLIAISMKNGLAL